MRPTPSAVIFDCDGVLVDSEVLALEVELAMLAEIGMVYEPAAYRRRFLGMADGPFVAALCADRLAQQGAPLPDSFAHDMHLRRRAACDERLAEVSGAARAVAALALPKAVASSTASAFLERKLRKTALWDLFAPHAYSADLVARAKPAPDIFLHAAGALGVDPALCLVLEDSVNGVLGARAAEMRAWGFTGGGHCGEDTAAALRVAGAERVVAGWAEAEAEFAAWR